LIIILAEYQYVQEGRKYLNVNEAFLKLYGFATKEEVIGKTGVELELITEADSNTVNKLLLTIHL
jgi:hypothetical protein